MDRKGTVPNRMSRSCSELRKTHVLCCVVPKLVENGGQVRVSVTANIPNTEWISLIAEKNPSPLTSWFAIREGAIPYVSLNLRLKESSNITALVKSGDKYFKASRGVLVSSDGCS